MDDDRWTMEDMVGLLADILALLFMLLLFSTPVILVIAAVMALLD